MTSWTWEEGQKRGRPTPEGWNLKIFKDLALSSWTWLGLALVAALVALFVYASSRQQQEIQSIVLAAANEEAAYMLGNLGDRLTFIASDLQDIARRSPRQSQIDHLAVTSHLIEANPFLQAINHVGADGRIEYVAPFEANKQVIGLKIEIPAPKEAREMAASTQRPYLSRPFEIVQGEVGYSMMVPDLDGRFFEIVFRADTAFGDQSLFRRRPDIVIRASDGGMSVFEDPDYRARSPETSQYEASVEAAVLNRTLRIDALPGDELLARSSGVWRIIATGGLVLSFVSLSAIVATQAFNIRRRQRAEERVRRLSLENEVLAEIGRTITSSLDIEEVYERFGEQVRRLIPFDSIAINLVNPDGATAVAAYILSEQLERHCEQGASFDLEGTMTQEAIEWGRGTVFSAERVDDMVVRYPGGHVAFQAGFHSFVAVPLISGGESIGVLLLFSAEINTYTERDLSLAERVGAQIAGAIANSQLYVDVQRSEERTQQLSHENEVLAEIGRTITSSLDIDEVYEYFAEQVRRLIPYDLIDIVTVDLERSEMCVEYAYGIDLDAPTAQRGYARPLAGSIVEEVARKGTGTLSVPRDRDELVRENPRVVPSYDLGLLSHVSAPLVAGGKSIGMLALLSRKSRAYTEQDLRLVRRVGDQIASAIANSQLLADLQNIHEQHRLLLDTLEESIALKDPAGRFLLVNKAFANDVGLPKGKIEGRFREDFHPDRAHVEEVTRQEAEITRTGEGTEGEMTADSGRGPRIYSVRSTPVLDSAGRVHRIVTSSWDITDRKQLEAQLVKSQKMEVVGRLAGGVAHEFNNLLTAILGFAYLLKESLSSGHSGRDYVDEIQAAADRAATITRQLLAFSRRETAEPKVFDLNDCVLNTGSSLRGPLGGDIEFVTLPSRERGMVKLDPGQMEQVLAEMALNARDAMPEGGMLTIETVGVSLGPDSAARLSGLQPGRYVRLAIRDTGTGMSEEVKARLFEPFFTTKDVGKGTGLGLSACHGIIKQSGGDISVTSEPGHGSTFEIYLPSVET